MIYLKLINAQQAKASYAYKNTKEKQHTTFIIQDTFIHLCAFLKFRRLQNYVTTSKQKLYSKFGHCHHLTAVKQMSK